MKRVLLPVLSLFMVMAILVNTSGITVYNHFCLEEGESSLSLTRLEKCCDDKKEVKKDNHSCCKKKKSIPSKNKIQKPGCCSQDEFSAQWQINEFSFQKNIKFNSSISIIPVAVPEFRLTCFNSEFKIISFSPPLYHSSGDFQSLFSVFLI